MIRARGLQDGIGSGLLLLARGEKGIMRRHGSSAMQQVKQCAAAAMTIYLWLICQGCRSVRHEACAGCPRGMGVEQIIDNACFSRSVFTDSLRRFALLFEINTSR